MVRDLTDPRPASVYGENYVVRDLTEIRPTSDYGDNSMVRDLTEARPTTGGIVSLITRVSPSEVEDKYCKSV